MPQIAWPPLPGTGVRCFRCMQSCHCIRRPGVVLAACADPPRSCSRSPHTGSALAIGDAKLPRRRTVAGRLAAMTAPTASSPRSILAATWALFAGVFLLTAGNGLQFTTVGVRSTVEDFDSLAIGVMTAAYYVGFLAGAGFTYRSLGRVGHLRVFAALASTASASVLMHTLFVNPFSWSLMRIATGFCVAGLFIVIESWISITQTPWAIAFSSCDMFRLRPKLSCGADKKRILKTNEKPKRSWKMQLPRAFA